MVQMARGAVHDLITLIVSVESVLCKDSQRENLEANINVLSQWFAASNTYMYS